MQANPWMCCLQFYYEIRHRFRQQNLVIDTFRYLGIQFPIFPVNSGKCLSARRSLKYGMKTEIECTLRV